MTGELELLNEVWKDFTAGGIAMRWDPDHGEWVWPERLPAELSWFKPEPYIDLLHILGYGTPDPEGQRRYALRS